MKLLGFAACMLLLYLVFSDLFAAAIPYAVSQHSAGPFILIAALLGAFAVYDRAFSILIAFFRAKILPKLH